MNTGEDPREGTLLCNLKFRDMSAFFAEIPSIAVFHTEFRNPLKGLAETLPALSWKMEIRCMFPTRLAGLCRLRNKKMLGRFFLTRG